MISPIMAVATVIAPMTMTNHSSDLELAEEVAPNHSLSWLYDAAPGPEQDKDRDAVEASSLEPWISECPC